MNQSHQSEPARGSFLKGETPLRRRARLRSERAATRPPHKILMPPLWVLLGALIVPGAIIFGGFYAQRLLAQAGNFANNPYQIVTPTPAPREIVPVPVIAWLSATPPAATAAAATAQQAGTDELLFVTATPGFSLSNSRIVFVCYIGTSDEICLMSADGQNMQQLTHESGATDWYPSFSRDGRTIIFSSQRSGDFDIYTMDLKGENVKRITRGLGGAYAPALSPDNSRVVFASTFDGVQDIWAINTDGTNAIRLTNGPRDNVDPVWSPDGTLISYTSTRSGHGDLMVMDADGSNVRQVTHGINVEGRNSWSPDGRSLAFYAGPPGDKDIYIVAVECAMLASGCGPDQFRKLTAGGNNKGPDYSPDGRWIAFASQLNGQNEIFIITVDGAELYQLTFNKYSDWQPRWGWQP